MKKEKIFFLINSMEGGGAERVISIISSELSNEYDVDLVTLKDINFYDLPKGVNHISLSNVKNNLLMFLLIPYYAFKFKKLLKKNSYKSGISSLEIANFVNILVNKNAIIAFEISIYFFVGIIGSIYKILIKILYPKAKLIKVNSEENKYDLANFLGIDLNKIDVIYNPIDLDKIYKLKCESVENDLLRKIKGKKVFITVGRLVWQKNHATIINSFKKVYNQIDKNWVYLIIGEGPENEKIQSLRNKLGLEKNIFFLGAQKNVFKYLNISNYFIYGSKIEGFPNVLGEAMACNLPIITSNFVSGAKECIVGKFDINLKNIKYPYYGENGVLLDFDNYETEFQDIYKDLNKLRQDKVGFERFNLKNIEKKFIKLLF